VSADTPERQIGKSNRWRVILLSAAAFTALAVLFGLQRHYAAISLGQSVTWFDAFVGAFVVWWSWGLLTPLIVRIARSIPISADRPSLAALQLPASVGVAVLHALIVATITPQFYWRPSIAPIRDMFRGRLSSALSFDMVVYFFITAVVYMIRYAVESRRREIASAQLAASLARTQLHALQVQLQPHFLFNTLNSILALVHDDPVKASLMIRRLSDLLRYCLASAEVAEVPLSEEVEFAKAYLEIQKIRFEERLEVGFAVDPDTLESLVPSFILQPLIENAVKFSLDDDRRVARIIVAASRQDGHIELTVTDNGPGIRDGDLEISSGVGVRTTQARLRQLYGDHHSIQFNRADGGGTRASISIPTGQLDE
jgi:signal transduction histidine kinase